MIVYKEKTFSITYTKDIGYTIDHCHWSHHPWWAGRKFRQKCDSCNKRIPDTLYKRFITLYFLYKA